MENNFLLEILTEGLPYQFIPSAEGQLIELFNKLFNENKINYKNIKTYATPRRLAVLIEGLDEKQQDIIKDIKGPVVNIALYKNGNYTTAAIGLAKKNGISTDLLIEKEN